MTQTRIRTTELNTQRALPDHPSRNISAVPTENYVYHPIIFALDPGETTGWTLIQVNRETMLSRWPIDEHILTFEHGQVDCGKNQGALETTDQNDPGLNPSGEAVGVKRIIDFVDAFPGAAILIEDFILDHAKAGKDRSSLSPVRVTARLEQELWHRARKVFRQSPSLAKTTMPDNRLHAFGLYQRDGGLKHARDSDRHALTFLRRCQLSPQLRWQAWPFIFPQPEVKVAKRKKKEPGQRIHFG